MLSGNYQNWKVVREKRKTIIKKKGKIVWNSRLLMDEAVVVSSSFPHQFLAHKLLFSRRQYFHSKRKRKDKHARARSCLHHSLHHTHAQRPYVLTHLPLG